MRPIIGITTQTHAVAGSTDTTAFWVVRRKYVDAIRLAGGVPWLIPLIPNDAETLIAIFERLDAILLPGGADVNPARYGEVARSTCGPIDAERDAVEIAAVHYALTVELPILAICRGVQILNVACGGTLYQDISTEVPGALKHDYFTSPENPARDLQHHNVTVIRGTRLSECLKVAAVGVNSMHHQAVKDLGQGLKTNALSADGIIEGIETISDQFCIGVQWHPEELLDSQSNMSHLFTALCDAATRRRQRVG